MKIKENIKIIITVIILLILLLFTNNSYAANALEVPETDINVTINNVTPGANVYLLIPDSLFKYNLEKYIENNINNSYAVSKEEAEKLQDFLNKADYLGYLNYYSETGNVVAYNSIELRHYTFSFGENEILGYYEYNNQNYIQIKINLNDENTFKLVLKDYLINYDQTKILFLVDDFGIKQYITLEKSDFHTNRKKTNITECNKVFEYTTTEEALSIKKSITITYSIIAVIATILIIILIFKIIKEHKKAKKEIEERRNFFKSPERIEKELEEKRNAKKNKKEKTKGKKK